MIKIIEKIPDLRKFKTIINLFPFKLLL